MSAEAMGFVFRHSPYKGAALMVHLAIADSVNDQNGNKFWMSLGKLATKCRQSRQTVVAAVEAMKHDGWLSELKREHGSTTLYQFNFVDSAVVYESRWGVVTDDRGVSSETTGGVVTDDTNPIEPKIEPKHIPSAVADGFNDFWATYPRRVGRKAAEGAFKKALKETSVDQIMFGLEQAMADWKLKDPKFIPHPTTWLNQGRYLDAVRPPAIPSSDAPERLQKASYALLEAHAAYYEGRAWRGIPEASYRAYRDTQPEALWEHLDRGYSEPLG